MAEEPGDGVMALPARIAVLARLIRIAIGVEEVLTFGGLAFAAAGLWLLAGAPIALIVVGAALFWLGVRR